MTLPWQKRSTDLTLPHCTGEWCVLSFWLGPADVSLEKVKHELVLPCCWWMGLETQLPSWLCHQHSDGGIGVPLTSVGGGWMINHLIGTTDTTVHFSVVFYQCLTGVGWVLSKIFFVLWGCSFPILLARESKLFLQLCASLEFKVSGFPRTLSWIYGRQNGNPGNSLPGYLKYLYSCYLSDSSYIGIFYLL